MGFYAVKPYAFTYHHRAIEVWSLLPCFDDFNEDLRRLGAERLRASVRRQLAPQDVVRFLALETAATG